MIDPAILAADAVVCRPAPSDEHLSSVAALAAKQQDLEQRVQATEQSLDTLKGELAKVSEYDLPDAMAAIGLTEFKLADGYKVTVGQEYYANIPSPDSEDPDLRERRRAAFAWLNENNHGDLIKSQIVVDAGRGEQEKAARVMRGLQAAGIPFNQTEAVHWSTLKAFVKEQMTATEGEAVRPPFPGHLFGAHVKTVARIKQSKKAK